MREVEVDTASIEDTAPTAVPPDDSVAAEQLAAEQVAAASVVLSAEPPARKPAAKKIVAAKPPVAAPIVAKPFSKFIVTVEFLDFVPPPANSAEPAAAGTGPTT